MRNKQLTSTERPMMEAMWKYGPMSSVEVWHSVEESTGWSKSTAVTVLGRMEKKGLVTVAEGPRGRLYSPAIGREDAAFYETDSLLKRVYNGSVGLMLSTLVENEALSDEDISELYDILKKAEEARK